MIRLVVSGDGLVDCRVAALVWEPGGESNLIPLLSNVSAVG